jgi:hypothetical protein
MTRNLSSLWILSVLAMALGCSCAGERDDIQPAANDDDSAVSAADDDDDDTVMPPDEDLTGTYPSQELPLPEFEALNSDGTVRGPDTLRGHPTVMWFFPFAGTPT